MGLLAMATTSVLPMSRLQRAQPWSVDKRVARKRDDLSSGCSIPSFQR